MYSYSDTSIVSQSQRTGREVGLVLFFQTGVQYLLSTGADIRFCSVGILCVTVHLSYTACVQLPDMFVSFPHFLPVKTACYIKK